MSLRVSRSITDSADGAYLIRLEKLRGLNLPQERYVQLKSILALSNEYYKMQSAFDSGEVVRYFKHDSKGYVYEDDIAHGGKKLIKQEGQEALNSCKQHLYFVIGGIQLSREELDVFSYPVSHIEKKTAIDGIDGDRIYSGSEEDIREFKLSDI